MTATYHVIPAQAGIQSFHPFLDACFRWHDNLARHSRESGSPGIIVLDTCLAGEVNPAQA
jgi:hypothetical protein